MSDKEMDVEAERVRRVRERAHAKWLDEGQVHGRDQEHWRDAEAEVAAEEEEQAAKLTIPSTPKPNDAPPSKSSAAPSPVNDVVAPTRRSA